MPEQFFYTLSVEASNGRSSIEDAGKLENHLILFFHCRCWFNNHIYICIYIVDIFYIELYLVLLTPLYLSYYQKHIVNVSLQLVFVHQVEVNEKEQSAFSYNGNSISIVWVLNYLATFKV